MTIKDLNNITTFSGITIESSAETGTTNINATFAVSNVTTAQRDLLENVTPYVVNGVTVRIKEGTIIFNISVDKLQMFRNGGWESITTNISTATGVGLSSSPFSIPSGPSDTVEVAANQVNGFIYYDTVKQQVKGYINSQWMILFSVSPGLNAPGIGLTNGSPFIFPSGPSTAVEVAANQIKGFAYYNITANNLRIYDNNNWVTVSGT